MHLSVFLSQQKKNDRKPRPNPPGCWWQSHPPYLANHGKRLRKTDLLKFKRTKVPVRVKRFLLQREVSNSSRNFYGKGLWNSLICEYIYIYSCIYVGNRGFICCIRYASTDWVKVFSFFFHTMFPKCVEILKMWHLRCKHGLLLSCLRIRQLPHTVADEHIWGLMGSNG